MGQLESIETMEEVIATLLRADKEAQEKLRGHQQLRQQMADQIAAAREEIQKDHTERAQKRIEAVRAQHQAEYDGELEKMEASYQAALGDLQQDFESHRGEWVDTLVRRCLE